jgi:hypothetical protein
MKLGNFACVVVVLFNSALLFDACTVGHACTEMGCSAAAHVDVKADAPASLETIRASSLTACWNDDCHTLSLATLEVQDQPNTFPPFDGTPITVTFVNGGGKPFVNVAFFSEVPNSAHDGDRFRVQMKDASGAELLSIDESLAHYSELRPNGADCAPVCYQAAIDKRSAT